MNHVAVLFARSDSNYRAIPGTDVFDLARDARTFRGGMPVVAHPPCRSWGRLRHFAKPRADEKAAAPAAAAPVFAAGDRTEKRVPMTRVRATVAKRLVEANPVVHCRGTPPV